MIASAIKTIEDLTKYINKRQDAIEYQIIFGVVTDNDTYQLKGRYRELELLKLALFPKKEEWSN